MSERIRDQIISLFVKVWEACIECVTSGLHVLLSRSLYTPCADVAAVAQDRSCSVRGYVPPDSFQTGISGMEDCICSATGHVAPRDCLISVSTYSAEQRY